jgi:hypothetical protein
MSSTLGGVSWEAQRMIANGSERVVAVEINAVVHKRNGPELPGPLVQSLCPILVLASQPLEASY